MSNPNSCPTHNDVDLEYYVDRAKRNGVEGVLHTTVRDDGRVHVYGKYNDVILPPRDSDLIRQFKITLKDKDGETFTDHIDFAPPDETGSDWVRLCDWVGVDPERPADLKNKILPIKRPRSNSEPTIHVPPVKGGLNPAVFSGKRGVHKLQHNQAVQTVGEHTVRTLPWWGTALGSIVSGGVMIWCHGTSVSGLLPLLAMGVLVGGSVMGFCLSFLIGLYYWGMAARGAIAIGFMTACRLLWRGWLSVKPFLFPEE